MHIHEGETAMNQKIFDLGLSVETVSVYLLCCGLADADQPITTAKLTEIWNGSPENLQAGLTELEKNNIITRFISDGQESHAYRVNPVSHWKR